VVIWGALRGNRAAYAYIKKNHLVYLGRWFRYIEEAFSWVSSAVETLTAQIQAKKAAKSKEGASYEIALPDTEKGVVTRFPPEPS
jgi:glutamyl-tRNA synthetase